MLSPVSALPAVAAAPTSPGEFIQPSSPSLWHILSPKFFAARTRPLGKTENRTGRLILFVSVGGIFWLFVFGLLYRLLNYIEQTSLQGSQVNCYYYRVQ